jgi:hypothetical protein
VLLSAVPASAQIAAFTLEQRMVGAFAGVTTDFDDFVEAGERPNDESVAWFLGESGFGPRELAAGWHSFPVDYGKAGRAGVQVKLTDGGTKLNVRLVQTRTTKSPRSKGLDPWLNPRTPQQTGVFRERTGLPSLTIATKGLTDAMLHRAILSLMNEAQEGR